MSNLEEVNKLKEMLQTEDIDIHIFHDELSNFISTYEQDIPLELFKLFKNYHGNDEHDRAMWTLLHGIESLRGEAYTLKIISGLKYITEEGSEWAELIAIRNLNSAEYRNRLAKYLKTAEEEDRVLWKSAIQTLLSNEPEFKDKAIGVLKSLN